MNSQDFNDHKMYQAILSAAHSSFINKGFDSTTVDDITSSLHISNDLFQKYFRSLDEILEALWAGSLSGRVIE